MKVFDYGVTYLSKKLHEKNRNSGEGNIGVLFLVPKDKVLNTIRIVPSGVNGNVGYVNILHSGLKDYEYFITKQNQLVVKKGDSIFIPYLKTIPNEQRNYCEKHIMKLIKDNQPLMVTKEFLEESKDLLKLTDTFSYFVNINSFIYCELNNQLVSGNPYTYYSGELKGNKGSNNYSVPTIKYDSLYLKTYYLEIYNVLQKHFSTVKGISRTKYNTIRRDLDGTDFILNESNLPTSIVAKEMFAKSSKQDKITKNIPIRMCDSINFEKLDFKIVTKIKNMTIYHGQSISYIEKELSTDEFIEFMDFVYSELARLSGMGISAKDVATSSRGIAYLDYIIENRNKLM